MLVPVVDRNQNPLMPTHKWRAIKWIKSGKATFFYKKGVFCVRLNQDPSDTEKQEIVVGIDPGSKREAYTVKSNKHTLLNILSNTPDWVKKAVESRRNARRARRHRGCRRRPARFDNRTKCKLAPSTKSRWQLKLRVCSWLCKMFPITKFIVEDIKARTLKGAKKWNKSFSPLEVGKNWFYKELSRLGEVETRQGYETKELRDQLGLKKSKSKLSDKFECHNVDSWVLANAAVGGHSLPENKQIIRLFPLRFHRRQLHVFQFSKGGNRRPYGSTRSLGFKRGSLVRHAKRGLCYVGGQMRGFISLHCLETGKRLTQSAKVVDCEFRSFNSWRYVVSSQR